jgi:lipoprotein-anchoring transpeptidase ErfK/SrfK
MLAFAAAAVMLTAAPELAAAATPSDTTPPTRTAPATRFTVGRTLALTTAAVPLTNTWTVGDAGSGVAYSVLERRTNSGAFAEVHKSADPVKASHTAFLKPDPTAVVTHRVRATDTAGNVSSYAVGPSFTVLRREDSVTSGEVSYTGTGWTSVSDSARYSGGSVRSAAAAGNSAKLSLSGHDFAIVATRGPGMGTFQVFVDGVAENVVNLYASTDAPRAIVWQRHFTSSAVHTLELRVLGTKDSRSSATTVELDAFVALQASAAPPAPTEALTAGTYVRIANAWTLKHRSQPNSGATILQRIPRGQVARIEGGPYQGSELTWYKISFRGKVGYSASHYLVPTGLAGSTVTGDYRKVVVVSRKRQQAEFYEDGKLTFVVAVTTGRPELQTPLGIHRVKALLSPYTFRSPWPEGHEYWYETWEAKHAVRFTYNGHYFHDSYRAETDFGYGTNVPHTTINGTTSTGSRGCVNMPPWAIAEMFPWFTTETRIEVTDR